MTLLGFSLLEPRLNRRLTNLRRPPEQAYASAVSLDGYLGWMDRASMFAPWFRALGGILEPSLEPFRDQQVQPTSKVLVLSCREVQ